MTSARARGQVEVFDERAELDDCHGPPFSCRLPPPAPQAGPSCSISLAKPLANTLTGRMIAVTCDNDSIHHARKVTAYLKEHPRLELLYGARYSPHDNPTERRILGMPLSFGGRPDNGPLSRSPVDVLLG